MVYAGFRDTLGDSPDPLSGPAGQCTPFSFLYAWAAYGTLHATATHVGKLPDCSKLGLGVREISRACT